MILVTKKRGETPLGTLERLRKSRKSLRTEKLSYIGRLDPMAEGEMLILVGDKENKERSKYLNFDKEYEAVFVVGVSTDSGDILGLITKVYKGPTFVKSGIDILKIRKSLMKLKTQKYPWMSGKTIGGKKMFEIFKEGKIDKVKRPTQKIKIFKISNIKVGELLIKKMEKDLFSIIPKVTGEFRQKETLKSWKKFFLKLEQKYFQTISLKIKVSSGTFIRGLCEELEKGLGAPVLLYRLKRTKIFTK
jgi:tRNA pseudouridine(55) synthase